MAMVHLYLNITVHSDFLNLIFRFKFGWFGLSWNLELKEKAIYVLYCPSFVGDDLGEYNPLEVRL